jgi:cephalosporin hydroxylase
MNPIEVFNVQKTENIRRLGNDSKLKDLSLEWMLHSSQYKYSYNFNWLGVPIIQFPQDMIALQELIWSIKPELIIETGIAHGGSLIFHASILELIGGKGVVLGVDIDIRKHNRKVIEEHPMSKRIRMIEGSSASSEVVERVHAIANGKSPIMIILDSNHTHEHVLTELQLYQSLVHEKSYIVVLDTTLEDVPENFQSDRPWNKGNNPKTAVHEFLKINKRFAIDADIENKLQITTARHGYLRCIKD